ncbi:hypothetical protein XH97_02610 [Bradyrhizobium sp. CCBAU 53380]|nr:hypothetical protein [Bradyrhizobium sp. CCBAU 53380]
MSWLCRRGHSCTRLFQIVAAARGELRVASTRVSEWILAMQKCIVRLYAQAAPRSGIIGRWKRRRIVAALYHHSSTKTKSRGEHNTREITMRAAASGFWRPGIKPERLTMALLATSAILLERSSANIELQAVLGQQSHSSI